MFRPVIRLIFLAKAAFEVGRERIEDVVDSLATKVSECKSNSAERVQTSRDCLKRISNELYQQVWQRSEVLESQIREKLKRQVADFSLGALGDATEINELRAELATLRAEIAELKSVRAAV